MCVCKHPLTRYVRVRPDAGGAWADAAVYLDFERHLMTLRCNIADASGGVARTAPARMDYCPLCGRRLKGDGR